MNTPPIAKAASRKDLDAKQRAQDDIRASIAEIHRILGTFILETAWPNEVFWPVVTRFVICLRDLVAKSERYGGKRIDFTDDVLLEGRIRDAASLIKHMRDALCHVESPNHTFEGSVYLSFVFIRGQVPNVIQLPGGKSLGGDYRDDVAFLFGGQRVYLKRHLIRAFRECCENLDGFLKQDFKNPS